MKRSGLNEGNLLTAYKSLIRSVVEYASSLTSGDINRLESIKKRALKIITPCMPYDEARDLHRLPKLEERRDMLPRKFFNATTADTQHKLHNLLPTKSENIYINFISL